tara:strand:+ start:9117 stop:9644 length:528 start_codon:yes stop_codon:yes gene_type:complete
LSIFEEIIFLKLYLIKFLKNLIINKKPIVADNKVGIKIETSDPKIINENINPTNKTKGLTSWLTKILYLRILKACVACEAIKVITVNGKLKQKTLMTVTKNFSSLNRLNTIHSALRKSIVEIIKLKIRPDLSDEKIAFSTLCLSFTSLLTNLRTPLSSPESAKISAILKIAFERE